MSTEGMAGQAAGCSREAAAPAPAGLPCQNSNNSDKPGYKLRQVPNASAGVFTDSGGKHRWSELEDGTLLRSGMPTSAEARSAFHLRQNIASFIDHWGRNHCLFLTVTDEANLHPKEFARKWNNYLRRNGAWIVSFIRVLEPQMRGNPHYHVLVAVLWDTKPEDFDWEAFDECRSERGDYGSTARFRELRARYKTSAAPELVALWSQHRKIFPRYGLGRAELLPLRKSKEAVSEYIGKYLEAGLVLKKHAWKGCRRVEFDRRNKIGWLACTRVFAWHSPGAIQWRKRVGELGVALGVVDLEGLRRIFGSKWAYRLRESITFATEDEWVLLQKVLKQYNPPPSQCTKRPASSLAFEA